jgi:hypothetical protein
VCKPMLHEAGCACGAHQPGGNDQARNESAATCRPTPWKPRAAYTGFGWGRFPNPTARQQKRSAGLTGPKPPPLIDSPVHTPTSTNDHNNGPPAFSSAKAQLRARPSLCSLPSLVWRPASITAQVPPTTGLPPLAGPRPKHGAPRTHIRASLNGSVSLAPPLEAQHCTPTATWPERAQDHSSTATGLFLRRASSGGPGTTCLSAGWP